jgi:polysaccharide biosynthesis transport protein
MDLVTEAAQLRALEARIKVLNTQLEGVRAEATALDEMSGQIVDLRRKREIEEANFLRYASGLEQARIADALGTGAISNIALVQNPSPPFVEKAKIQKISGGLAVVGLALGLAWAFAIEFYLDRTIRRPVDVERTLHLPLFLSIPKLALKKGRKTKHESKGTGGANGAIVPTGATIPPWDERHALHPFHETLRDRLIGYFESQGLIHKPKLVAVTGLGRGTGVTTTAAGLASSLSETGDGNVLLVDMTATQGSSQQFYQGKAVCGLEDILDTRQSAQVEGNLFVVGEEPAGDRLGRILPQRFSKLIPKLKASDFDYIIFDMPPVSQISITPRLAGFMDMVLLVVESEKADQELVQRATALLAESKAHVGAVLNKTVTYVPSKLHQEYLGNT